MKEEKLWEAFNFFDTDKSGFITKEDLQKALLQNGTKFSAEEIQNMINDVDIGHDNKISFNQFKNMTGSYGLMQSEEFKQKQNRKNSGYSDGLDSIQTTITNHNNHDNAIQENPDQLKQNKQNENQSESITRKSLQINQEDMSKRLLQVKVKVINQVQRPKHKRLTRVKLIESIVKENQNENLNKQTFNQTKQRVQSIEIKEETNIKNPQEDLKLYNTRKI